MTEPVSIRQIAAPADWQRWLALLPARHFLQAWEWGEVKAQTGWQTERYIVTQIDDDTPIGAFQFLWRQPIPGVPLRVAYLPKGPLLNWTNESHVAMVLDAVEVIADSKRCIFVKIDPDVRSDSEEGVALQNVLESRGWQFSREQIQFKNSAISALPTDLDPIVDEAGIEAALQLPMKNKWRYNIRLARKRGIIVRHGGSVDLRQFYEMYVETAGRDHFAIRPFDYYQTLWQTFLDAQNAPENPAGGVLLLAEHAEEDEPVAGLFLTRYAEQAAYFNGASTHRRRRDMPNHLLQYEALRWAYAQGCTHYDWWGAPTDLDDLDDSMQGVWGFKQGFGANFDPHVGAWDRPGSKRAYHLYVDGMPHVLNLMRKLRR